MRTTTGGNGVLSTVIGGAYVLAVRQLAVFHNRSPDRLSREEVREWIHHLIVERRLADRRRRTWQRFPECHPATACSAVGPFDPSQSSTHHDTASD